MRCLKNYIMIICQLPVILLLSVVFWAEQGLTWCLGKLSNPLLCPFARAALRRIVENRETDNRSDFHVFMDWLHSQDDDYLEAYRIHAERKLGIPAEAKDFDPHLYAALKPSREENIERIANSVCGMNPDKLQCWLSEMRELLQ